MLLGYNLIYPLERLSHEFKAFLPIHRIPLSSTIRPGQVVPVVMFDGEARAIEFMHWGYYASGYSLVHEARVRRRFYPLARLDQISNSRLYARSLELNRRCLVPANAFLQTKLGEHPHRARLTMHEVFAFAGIWTLTPAGPSAEQGSFALLTTESCPSLLEFGPRMPVCLPPRMYRAWLQEKVEVRFLGKALRELGFAVARD